MDTVLRRADLDRGVDGRLVVRGYDLRYCVTIVLADARRPMAVRELVAALAERGLVPAGRPSKTVSDSLRREIGKGRVLREGWGRYRVDRIPESTFYRLRQHVAALQQLADARPGR